jgi:phage terminase large subunit-like protein
MNTSWPEPIAERRARERDAAKRDSGKRPKETYGFGKAKINREKRDAIAPSSRQAGLPPRTALLTTRRNRGRWREEFDEAPWENPDLPRTERVVLFIESLTVTSGPEIGKLLELRSWQREFIEEIYREDPGSNLRPVRTAVLSMGRKNGKTQLAAALALVHLVGPEAENRGEVYSCANDRFQAAKIYSEMVAMIERSPILARRVITSRPMKTIEDIVTGSIYVALSREARTKMGLSPSFVVYDELGQTEDRDLYDAMDSAMGARRNPLMLVISTQAAGDLAPLSRLIDYGLRVKSGEVDDPHFHLTFHSAPADADPWLPETWKLANPALGDFRSLEDVERLAAQARRMPTQENAFRNLILNQRVAAETRFIERTEWVSCSDRPEIPPGAKVYAALDLGSTRDLSALVVVYEDAEQVFHVLPFFWLPGDVPARTAEDRVPYDVWVREGYITPIGVSTDPRVIAEKIGELTLEYKLQTLAFDRWRINDLKRECDALGLGARLTLVPHGQGYKDMSPAVDVLERLVVQRRIRHGGHPVLTWCAYNAVVTRDATGARKLDKARSIGRIDGLVALAMAFSLAQILDKPIDIEALIG